MHNANSFVRTLTFFGFASILALLNKVGAIVSTAILNLNLIAYGQHL